MGWHGGSARVAAGAEPATAARSGHRQAGETLTEPGPVTAPPATASQVLLRLQRTRGNQYVQRLLQPKLLLGQPGDQHEREADRLAEDLTENLASGVGELDGGVAHQVRGRSGPRISRAGTAGGGVLDPAVHRLLLDTGAAGTPLPASVRGGYERALHADFSGVRVHTSRQADEINVRLRSSAVTVGRDIFFRRGEYDLAGDTGRELLTHELVHVLQQGTGAALVQPGRGRTRKRRRTSQDDDPDYVPDYEESTSPVREPSQSPEPEDTRPAKKKRKKRSASPGAGQEKASGKKADATEIPVQYLSLAKMTKYLAGQKLTTDKDPKAISVGAVVWNINHLKADKSDVESDDDDVIEVDDAEGTAVREKSVYDVKAILAAMQTLRTQLADAAGPLTAAADAATAHLEGQDTSKHVSAARREVSQVKTDIAQLSGNDLDKVLAPGIAAMTQEGKVGIEARADQLEQVRAVARVWKRLVRLRTVLTGAPRIAEKKTAFATIRKALRRKVRERLGGAIDALLAELPVNDIGLAVNALKRGTVVDLATGTFFQNPAVNLVLINEMNLGIGQLGAATAKNASRLGLSQGPVMLAKGRKAKKGAKGKGKAAITVGAGADKQQVTGRQYEYYPAVHRTDGERGLTARGTFYVSTAGQFAVQGKDGTNSAISWDKAKGTYRGIVVHRYQQAGQEFWAGILHTTPAGKDLERTKIWPQISTPLARLNELALHFRVPLLIGGDFYIPSEGIVKKPTATQQREITASDPLLVTTVKLHNIARNVFLTAAAEKTPDAVDRLVTAMQAANPNEIIKNYEKRTKTKAKPKAKAKPKKKGKAEKPRLQPVGGIHKPDMMRRWRAYTKAASTAIDAAMSRKKPTYAPELALALLAPGTNYNANWKSTLAAGIIKQLDIIRNYRRLSGSKVKGAEPRLTMKRVLEELGYEIVEAGSPTNPKEHGRGENKMQLADLFLVNRYWQTTRSGIVTPGKAELKPVDDAELSATRTYWKISDHSPVLMLGSSLADDPGPHGAFQMAQGAAKKAVEANQAFWDEIEKLLGAAKTKPATPTVGAQVAAIKKELEQPLTGPRTATTEALRARARQLRGSVEEVKGFKPGKEQRLALDRLRAWKGPIYTTDYGEESPAGQSAGQGVPDAGKETPATHASAQAAGPGVQAAVGVPGAAAAVVPPQPVFPTGQIAWVDNSCYLASLIHVLASHQAFRDLLAASPARPAGHPGVTFATDSGLRALVTTLRDPQATIGTDEMATFMRYLDGLGNVLEPEDEPAEKKTKKKKKSTKATQKSSKEALKQAQEATKARKTYGVQQDAALILLNVLDRLSPANAFKVETHSTITQAGLTGAPTSVHDPMLSLPIDTQPPVASISAALAEYAKPEQLEGGGTKQMRFNTLPPVLTIALKRFRLGNKINRSVTADDPLDIPDACLTPTLQASLNGGPARYRLLHVVHHEGDTREGGHYRSFGKVPGTDTWYRHDDTSPTRRTFPSAAAVKAAHDTGYIYVYVRVP